MTQPLGQGPQLAPGGLGPLPKISCITTVYNEADTLMISVNSILNQSFQDFEYIIVDDGSESQTHDVLAGLKDPRFKIIYQANDGLSGARNKGLEQVTGDYVCFLDADDSRPVWAFAAMAAVIDRDAPDLVLCQGMLSEVRDDLTPFYDAPKFRMVRALTKGAVVAPDHPDISQIMALAQLMEPQSANKLVRSAFLKSSLIGFPNSHFFEDIYFHTSVLARAQRISFLDTPCFSYFRRYMRPQITSSSTDLRFDIIAVTKLTLEVFARQSQFHDPLHRAAVVLSCAKILQWCGDSISHHHRYNYWQAAKAMYRLVEPLYFNFPKELPETVAGLREFGQVRQTLEALTHG